MSSTYHNKNVGLSDNVLTVVVSEYSSHRSASPKTIVTLLTYLLPVDNHQNSIRSLFANKMLIFLLVCVGILVHLPSVGSGSNFSQITERASFVGEEVYNFKAYHLGVLNGNIIKYFYKVG